MRMFITPLAALATGIAIVALLGMPAHAQQGLPANELERTVPPSTSVAQANATLVQANHDRDAVEAEYAASEEVCNNKFFVNYCLDKVKETRRVALVKLRAVEVEAEHFKREESVRRRDADLAERARKDAEEQARRDAVPAKPPKEEKTETVQAAPKGPRVAQREADYAARMKRLDAQAAAKESERAGKVAAFERKQVDTERRQAEVAKRVAESQRKQAARAEAERKKAAAAKAAADAAAQQK